MTQGPAKSRSLRLWFAMSCTAIATAMGVSAVAAETIKVGIIAPFSGPFAEYGKQFKESVEVYVAQNGSEINGNKIELIYRDEGGANPAAAKSLAQELIVKDGVKYIGGFQFTPNALAIAPLIQEAKIPTVIFNAATSIITTKSDYFLRTSFTLWQMTQPLGGWVAKQGQKTAVVAVSDFAPGHDASAGFRDGYTKGGGQVLDEIRMPLNTTDFAPFMQRIKEKNPAALFAFMPAGPPTFAFIKAFNENGLGKAGIKLYGTGETDESMLQPLGDSAIGIVTGYHYSPDHDSALNKAYLKKREELFKGSVANFAVAGAYDGIHLIYQMIKAAGGDGDKAVAAAKGMAWESIRGPVKIDPTDRHVIQNVYLRRVVRDEKTGLLVNREFEVIKDVPDLGLRQK